MSIGRGDQIEWKRKQSQSNRWAKRVKHKRERLRARQDVTCVPEYRKYYGWEW